VTSLTVAIDNGISREALRVDLWRRSARYYQAAGSLLQAAEAWLAAGNKNTAAEQFAAADDDFRAAELFYECGRFSEAVNCAECCLKALSEKALFQRSAVRLVQAAALIKLDQVAVASNLLRDVRKELSRFTGDGLESRSQAGRAWESLAGYGVRAGRPDLLRLGYEKALLIYGSELKLQRLRCADDYLGFIKSDKILAADLKGRIAKFKCELGNYND